MSKQMLSIIKLDFNPGLSKQNEYKPIIYNKGKIVGKKQDQNKIITDKSNNNKIQRIQTAKNPTRPNKFEISVHDVDENQYIGNILSDVFSKEEKENKEEMSPSPKINIQKAKMKEEKYKLKEQIKKKKAVPSSAYLKPTTNSGIRSNNTNTFLEADALLPSNAVNLDNDLDQVKNKVNNNQKKITEKDLKQTIRRIEESNQIQNKILTLITEGSLTKSNHKSKLINAQIPQESLVKINPQQNEALEKKAAEDIERTGIVCNHLIKYAKEIDFELKDNMKTLHQFYIRNEFDPQKGKELVEEIKEEIKASPSFDPNQLNEKDKRLMTSKLNYHPKKREPIRNLHHNDEKYANQVKKNDNLLNKSSRLIQSVKVKRNNIQKQINKNKVIEDKVERVKQKGEFDNYFGSAYQNLYAKGKTLEVKDIKQETNKEVDSKEDLYDYVYLKEKESTICYYHPFLADGGML